MVLEVQVKTKMQKVYMCITVAQEINGRNIQIRVDKASKDKTVIDSYLSSSNNSWVEKMKTPEGNVDFYCERHPQEVEITDE